MRHPHRARASAKSPLGEALAYIARYRDGLGRFLSDGRVEIDNNTVERTIRPIALNVTVRPDRYRIQRHGSRLSTLVIL